MKTQEDEAWEEMERRQGGGGFPAKRAMAADKLLEKATRSCNHIDEQRALDALMREALAQPAQEPRDIAKLVEGMEVSIDVSTGEHDSGNRLFGTVTLAQENQSSKHGLILLVQEPEPNFKTTTTPQRERVVFPTMLRKMWSGGEVQAWLDENVNKERRQGGGFPAKRAMAADKLGWPPSSVITPEYLAEQENKNKKMRALLDDDDIQDYRKPWRGLTDEQRLMALKFIDPKTARLPPGFKQFAEAIEKLLKDQNV